MYLFKKLLQCVIALFLIGSSVIMAENKPDRVRIAIFDESGFPGKSKRSIDWFKKTLSEAGMQVSIVGLKEIQNPLYFSCEKYDTIIFPHGGYVPLDAEEGLGRFMSKGGTVIIAGDIFGRFPYPDDVKAQYEKLSREFQTRRSFQIEEYGNFLMKNGLEQGCFLRYSPNTGKWIAPVAYLFFHNFMPKKIMDEFELCGWPNYSAFLNPRPFNEALVINPLLKSKLQGFPESILPETEVKKNKEKDLFRVQKISIGTGSTGVYNYNILIPLYRFTAPSGCKYPSFESAGNQEEDCNTDFFIYRYHDYVHNGATLIVLGKAGSVLFESEKGEDVLIGLLKLAESVLPGEFPAGYYRSFHLADKLISDFNRENIQLCSKLFKYATALYRNNDTETFDSAVKLWEEQKKTFNDINSKYVTLSQFRNRNTLADKAQIDSFISSCKLEIEKSQNLDRQYSAKLASIIRPPQVIEAKHPFKELIWEFATAPIGAFLSNDFFRKIKEMGINKAPLVSMDWEKSSEVYDTASVSSGYRMFSHTIPHAARKEFNMGILNPLTGQVSYKKETWFNSPDAWEKYESEISWFLKKAQSQKGIATISYGDERDMEWSLWDDYMRERFLKYLQGKYNTINNLNNAWGTAHTDFSQIQLPLKRPESQPEHALWEDWTRYREVYRFQEEVIPEIRIAKKYAPNLIHWYYGSYNMQGIHPANGINYYETGKLLNPASMEGNFTPQAEILNADICGFQKKVIISEWGTFYFPPAGDRAQIDLLKESIWNSVNWGMIACHTFIGWQNNSNFITPDGLIQPLGYQIKELNQDFKFIKHIYLDGDREEVPIRIVYSPTTRRHTSWPDIEKDKSLEEVSGYYDALRSLHYQARAIDEQAIMEGKLPKETKVIIVPQVTYMNSELFQKLGEFVKSGGILITTIDSGSFDEYGNRKDYLLSMAGVSCNPSASQKVGGIKISTFAKDVSALNAVFPENSKAVLSYDDGKAAGILSTVEKGKLLVLGFPFGREYNSVLKKDPAPALALLKKILDSVGIEQDYICSDDHLVVRPWNYCGDKYLMLNYLQRSEMIVKKESKGFPLKKTSGLIQFDFSIRGSFDVDDYLSGQKLQTSFDGTFTIVKGIIENPGGAVYKLIPATNKKISAVASKKEQIIAQQTPEASSQNLKAHALPFEGRLFWGEGKVKLGDYTFSSDIVTEGGWSGKFYATIELNGKAVKKECKKGETVKFRFLEKTLILECEDVVSVMPCNIKCRISEIKNAPSSSGCRIREENFHGQASIVMENDYVFARILPGLGGRIIELKHGKDYPNNMFCDTKAISTGLSNSWMNYGGMEENAGGYPGPCWNIPFKYKIMENSNERIVLKLEKSTPIRWAVETAKKREGYNSFEKTFTIETGKAVLTVKIRQYNENPREDTLTLRTHPLFNIGGDVNSADILYFPDINNSVVKIPYRSKTSTQVKNNGSWCVFMDGNQKTGIVQTFEKNAVSELYTWMGESGYNVELVYDLFKTPGGKYVDFDYNIGMINGLSGISGFSENTAVDIIPEGNGIYGKQQKVKFIIDAASLENTKLKMVPMIKNKKGELITEFKPIETAVMPEDSSHSLIEWNTADLPDGIYTFTVSISDSTEKVFQIHAKFKLAGESTEQAQKKIKFYRAKIDDMKKLYPKNNDNALRDKIVKGSITLNELEEAIKTNDRSKIEVLFGSLDEIVKK